MVLPFYCVRSPLSIVVTLGRELASMPAKTKNAEDGSAPGTRIFEICRHRAASADLIDHSAHQRYLPADDLVGFVCAVFVESEAARQAEESRAVWLRFRALATHALFRHDGDLRHQRTARECSDSSFVMSTPGILIRFASLSTTPWILLSISSRSVFFV